MARINLVVSDEIKKKWDNYVKKSEITTLSKLIRKSVEDFIELKAISEERDKISNLSHKIKEELSLINGYSQMLIQDLKDKLEFEHLKKLNSIYQSSDNIESILKLTQESKNIEREEIDVLIIDDNRDYIELVSQIIKDNNLSYRASLSGKAALELLKIYSPKLILLDIFLPDLSGYEVCSKIKQDDKTKNIPIYYITAVPEAEVLAKVVETKAEGYLIKGFEISEFKKLLAKHELNKK
ncbi:MAG: response regulator [Promethearchaeota archaeon]